MVEEQREVAEEEEEGESQDALPSPTKSSAGNRDAPSAPTPTPGGEVGGSDLEWFDPDLSGFSAAGQSVKSQHGEQ